MPTYTCINIFRKILRKNVHIYLIIFPPLLLESLSLLYHFPNTETPSDLWLPRTNHDASHFFTKPIVTILRFSLSRCIYLVSNISRDFKGNEILYCPPILAHHYFISEDVFYPLRQNQTSSSLLNSYEYALLLKIEFITLY